MKRAASRRVLQSPRTQPRRLLVLVSALALAIGLAACGTSDDLISFGKYVDATVDVVEANGMEIEVSDDIDCDGNDETNNVTCTGETTEGQSIESTGENLGDDDATLVVTVDGEILFDGLLEEARGSEG
jgi:hypothetical protein